MCISLVFSQNQNPVLFPNHPLPQQEPKTLLWRGPLGLVKTRGLEKRDRFCSNDTRYKRVNVDPYSCDDIGLGSERVLLYSTQDFLVWGIDPNRRIEES